MTESMGQVQSLLVRDLYPLPDVVAAMREKVDEAFAELDGETGQLRPEDIVEEEITRLFGPAPSAEWPERFSGLARLIRVTEQQAENEKALAKPFEEVARGHRIRGERFERTAKAYRRALAVRLAEVGGKFSDGMVKMHLRKTERVSVIGQCASHPGTHFEQDDCAKFTVDDMVVPRAFLRITVEPAKDRLREALLDDQTRVSTLGFAKMVEGPPSVVIR